jgi:hypothetical protein
MSKSTTARRTSRRSTAAAPEMQAAPPTEAPDLVALIVAGLAAGGIAVELRWAPSGNYASALVGTKNIGYVFKQTRTGVRVEPAASPADIKGKGIKGFTPGKRSERFALVGVIKSEAEVGQAVAVLTLAAAKLAPAVA